jgi:two-component system osmolarity sensor histidine kinase EnvZ
MSRFRLRNFTPRGLYARLAMLVAVPVLAIFAITTVYYYREHISAVNEKLSQSIAREVGLIIRQCTTPAQEFAPSDILAEQLGLELDCNFPGGMDFPENAADRFAYGEILRQQMENFIDAPVEVRATDNISVLDFRSPNGDGAVRVLIDRKRALAANTHFTIVWVLLGALFMLALAFGFLRNQVRSILRLTEAATAYGRGRQLPGFRPSGPTEVRDAARAVMDMRARLTAFTEQRTALLAGVSHDLRTPLTRLKLQLAMMQDTPDAAEARSDIEEMEAMLAEYLAFARGEEIEAPETVDLTAMVRDVAARFDHPIELGELDPVSLVVRPLAIRRSISNLLSNAVDYGETVRVRLEKGPHGADLLVDDDGPGIAADLREEAFRPFTRLDGARSRGTPGTGLGLGLARDTARAHGGDVRLEDSPLGGLRARLRLPL